MLTCYIWRRERAMRRRDLLAGAGSVATATSLTLPSPAIAQGIRQLKMVTDWPEWLPGLLPGAQRLARAIGEATGGRIRIEVFASGAFVRPLETFDAVSAGVADMYHGSGLGSTWRWGCTKRRAITTIPVSTSRAPSRR